MNILKKSALGVCVSLLFVTLFVFGLAFGVHRVFSGPDNLKNALRESGIYQSVVGDALNQVQKEQQPSEGEQIPLDNPEVQNAIKTAVSPELLQSQTEQALDSIYSWLQGKTPKLEFAIDLGNVKQSLADNIGKYVEERAAALPVCPPGTPINQDFDAFNATCLPRGATAAQVTAQAKDQILKGEFFKDNVITAENFKGKDGKTIEQQLAAVPEAYKKLSWTVYGTGLLALLLIAAVVALSANWRAGLKKVSVVFIIVGSITVLLNWLSSLGVQKASEYAKEPLQQSGIKVAQHLADDLREWWLWYGIGLVVIGIITLIVLHFIKPKVTDSAAETGQPQHESEPAQTFGASQKPKNDVKQKPKPVKKLVQ